MIYTETERLRIRDFAMADLNDLKEIVGDEETMHCLEPAYDIERTREFLADFCIRRRGALAAQLKESGKMIGYILFNETEKGVFEAGWIFNRGFWRQGLAFEALKAVFGYGFEIRHADKIFAETIDVVRSVRLMEKLGMTRENVLISHTQDIDGMPADMYVYSINSAEWSDRRDKIREI